MTAARGLWTIDGLLTGLHEPESSHLEMLTAAAGHGLIEHSYQAAHEHGYLARVRRQPPHPSVTLPHRIPRSCGVGGRGHRLAWSEIGAERR